MLTTCPECRTTFRIRQAQLDCRRGLVRCGRCGAVFNAYDTLLPELQTPAETEARATAGSGGGVSATLAPEKVEASALAPPQPHAAPLAAGETNPAAVQPAQPAAGEPLATRHKAADSVAVSAPKQETPDAILLSELPVKRPSGELTNVLWGLASTALILTFGLQLLYFLRAELVHAWPQSRPLFAQACARLGCDLPLPQDTAAVRIDASSLETDPEDSAKAVLSLTRSNRSSHTVAWPHLLLTLTDQRDAPVAQRPFAPTEYLVGKVDVARGMPPGLEYEVRLDLELDGLLAYGYKLEMRYP